MNRSTTHLALLQLLIFTFLHKSTFAAEKSYIVLIGAHPHDVEPKLVDVEKVESFHHELLGSILGSKTKAKRKIHYSYTMHINAFGALLDEDLARNISEHPDVISVLESKASTLHTTHSWEFLGMEKKGEIPVDSLWNKASLGKDIIIANLDDGVWPTSKSFSDDGILGPIPSKWQGFCKIDAKSGMGCNNKLIGAQYFNKAFAARCNQAVQLNMTIETPPESCYDDTPIAKAGHGTHTLSTAGGSLVPDASVFGQGIGTAKGGAPMARVAAYRVCYQGFSAWINNVETYIGDCTDLDVVAGFDAAIADGVDVINMSLGGGALEFYEDPKAVAAFHAAKRGIVVVASAGNHGPQPASVDNVSPWIITVASTTTDRDFINYVVLANANAKANGTRLMGTNLSDKKLEEKPYPIITGLHAKAPNATVEDAIRCKRGAIDLQRIRDMILICRVNMTSATPSTISEIVARGGGIGFVSINDDPKRKIINTCPLTFVPSSHLEYDQGEALFAYINSTKNPMLYITPIITEFGSKPAPVISYSSSRGPNPIQPSILKPDIIAPGVNIMAAYPDNISPSMSNVVEDKRRVPFITMSGTSMAAPHVAGIVGLLKSIHPNWSPAAIKSAIMTTASTEHNKESIMDSTMLKATPFEYGAGQVQPNQAMDPGLVYDLTNDDYLNFLCAHGYNHTILKIFSHVPYNCPASFTLADFNYPSIAIPNLGNNPMTITRRLKNVGSAGTYQARVNAPPGITIDISPPSLTFTEMGEEKVFALVINRATHIISNDYVFGQLVWSDGKHFVKSPLVVKSSP